MDEEKDDSKTNIDTTYHNDDFNVILSDNDYYYLFNKLGYEKSKKMVNYLMAKVMSFGGDYRNPSRLKIMNKLKIMKPIYEDVFNKDMI